MQESYRQALGGIYPVPVLFFAKALYAMRESVATRERRNKTDEI